MASAGGDRGEEVGRMDNRDWVAGAESGKHNWCGGRSGPAILEVGKQHQKAPGSRG
jgi:hypothetical protein